MCRVAVMTCVVVGLWLACGQQAQAADYTTCFAFDPVFVQADQRQAPVAAPVSPQPSPQARGQEEAKRAPRMTLTTVSRALKALLGTAETTDENTKGR